MKKKIISVAFVVAIALAAGYNVYNSQNKVALSDLALDNVEALASGEGGGGFNCFWVGNYTVCAPWGTGTGCPCGI